MQTETAAASPIAIAAVRAMCASGEARDIRERAQLTLSEIARYLEVDHTTVSLWERGKRRPIGHRAVLYLGLLEQLREQQDRPRRLRPRADHAGGRRVA